MSKIMAPWSPEVRWLLAGVLFSRLKGRQKKKKRK
jgi:hypothetical protein